MQWLLLLKYAPFLLNLLPKVRKVITEATDNESAAKNLKDAVEGGYDILMDIGNEFFPGVLPDLRPVAAATVLDPELVTYVQNALNKLTKAGLEIDGHFGDVTKAEVEKYQAQKGLEVDGWPGEKTRAALAADLAKL